jgi:small-conductance mechanosensitive channel
MRPLRRGNTLLVEHPLNDRGGLMPAALAILIGVLVLAVFAHTLGFFFLRRAADGRGKELQQSLIRNMRWPTRLIIPLAAVEVALTSVNVSQGLRTDLLRGIGVALVFAVGFLIVRLTYVFDDVILARYQLDVTDNLKARRIHTQIQVLRRVTVVVVAVVSIAVVLLSIPRVRAAGAGLLASAGIVGIVAGVAAKPTATNLVAGLQIAISQPIRVDDVVVVEGQWGRIEQIALTYVVVRVWDLRRLVLPVSYFIQNPFENWTRSTADILGWVFLQVDFSAPVDQIRARFEEILRASPDWDGKVAVLQVTDVGDNTMQLRALMSSPDSSRSWDLQCDVREQLIDYLRREHPAALPRRRTELVNAETDPLAKDLRAVFAGQR